MNLYFGIQYVYAATDNTIMMLAMPRASADGAHMALACGHQRALTEWKLFQMLLSLATGWIQISGGSLQVLLTIF